MKTAYDLLKENECDELTRKDVRTVTYVENNIGNIFI